jgi:hypothetical protein
LRFLLVAVAALVFAGNALADTTFTDASGETAGSADITTIVASNDATAHTFKFAVQIANMPTWEPNSEIDIVFDSDQNAATGQQGFDYLFFVDSTGPGFGKWDGTKWVPAPSSTITSQYTNGLLTVVFGEADIATAVGKTFNFGVLSFRGPDPANPIVDTAGVYAYTLAAAPAPPPVVKPATVASTSVTATVAKAGAKFRVGPFEVNLSDGTVVSATAVKCTATLGGAKLKGTGAGGCTFALPKAAKKKRLVVKVSGVYAGAKVSKTVTYVVK